jgi:hypothetical protein
LGVSIDVHLDDTAADGGVDFLPGRSGPTMENKVPEGEASAIKIKDM